MNKLYYGDNLAVLREHIADESVDLVYLDPPFNSNATYNVLFRAPSGEHSKAQIEAFEDTWHWNQQAEEAYWQVLNGPSVNAAKMLRAMREFLGENDMMAYLAMMAVRLIELHRVLKPTGSLYLHCDPTASHYLKLLLDGIFGKDNFRNEIIWQRSTGKSLMSRRLPKNHDVIFGFQKTEMSRWNEMSIYTPYDESDLPEKTKGKYKFIDDDGRLYRLDSLINPNSDRPNLTYEFLGVTRVWRWTRERMAKAYAGGLVVQSAPGRVPQLKRFLDEQRGLPLSDVWTDIPPVNSQAKERLGYPTQKPVALLERILTMASNEGDVVLDPFCGCGTTVHAAQKLNRHWIGIDITHLAIALIERRLKESFGTKAAFATYGVPKDLAGARALADKNKFEFERWAVTLIPDAQPYKSKGGGDSGVDGILYFKLGRKESGKAVISVKGGKTIKPSEIRDLKGTVEREKAAMGLFITLAEPSKQMIAEAAAAGFVDLNTGLGVKTFPKIQILTIESLLDGGRPSLPVIDSTVYKRAAREDMSESNQGDLEL